MPPGPRPIVVPRPLPACRHHDPDLWFPVGYTAPGALAEAELAKEICGGCPLRAACLQHAMDKDIQFGIWGGLTEFERMELKRILPVPRRTLADQENRTALYRSLASA